VTVLTSKCSNLKFWCERKIHTKCIWTLFFIEFLYSSSTRVYRNPSYRGTTSSEDETVGVKTKLDHLFVSR